MWPLLENHNVLCPTKVLRSPTIKQFLFNLESPKPLTTEFLSALPEHSLGDVAPSKRLLPCMPNQHSIWLALWLPTVLNSTIHTTVRRLPNTHSQIYTVLGSTLSREQPQISGHSPYNLEREEAGRGGGVSLTSRFPGCLFNDTDLMLETSPSLGTSRSWPGN